MTKKESVLKIFLVAVCAFAVAFSFAEPERTAGAVRSALLLCVQRVVPGVFVFMVAARVLALLGAARIFSRITGGFLEKLFGVSAGGAAVIAIGLFAGYPTGAALAYELMRSGELDAREAERIIPFATAASPAFLLASVGKLCGERFGSVMLASQVASALLLLLLTRGSGGGKAAIGGTNPTVRPLAALSAALKSSGAAAINICSFVTFFYVLSEIVLSILPYGASGGAIGALVAGLMEISCGFSRLAGCGGALGYFCGGAILGFGGFSVLLQSADAAGDGGFCAKRYLLCKAVQGLLCGALAVLFGSVFGQGFSGVFVFFGEEQGKVAALWQIIASFALIFAFLLLILKIFAKIFKKLWKKSNL